MSCLTFIIQKKIRYKNLNCCKALERSLNDGESRNIDGNDLCCDLTEIARRFAKSMTPQDMLTFLVQQKLLDNVPNALIELRILLTLPVSVAKVT